MNIRSLGRLLLFVLVAASIATIAYLTEQRSSIDNYARMLALLDRIEGQLSDLHAGIFSAQLGELTQYDDIAADERQLRAYVEQLEQAARAGEVGSATITDGVRRLREDLEATRVLVGDAVRYIASRRSSLHYIPLLLESLESHALDGDSRLLFLAYRYHSSLLSQAVTRNQDASASRTIARLADDLREELPFTEGDQAALLKVLLQHGSLVVAYSEQIRQVLAELKARRPARTIQSMRDALRVAISERQWLSARVTRGLYALLLLLALTIAYIWLRMRSTAKHLRHSNLSLAQQIGERRQMESLLEIQRDTLEQVASASDLQATLNSLCEAFEKLVPGSTCSVVHAPDEQLRFLAAPSIDATTRACFEDLTLAPGQGSCAATILGEDVVFVADVLRDEHWGRVRELAARFDVRGCWSHPVYISSDDTGSFALMRAEPGLPDGFQRYALETGARLAGIAIRRAQDNERIQHMATRDALTSLPNRTLLKDRLELALARARRHAVIGGLLFIDLDHFKNVNDSKGHTAGDQLLVTVAGRMKACLRSSDTVARLGGDEFVVLLDELGDSREVAEGYLSRVAEKIRSALAEPYRLEGSAVSLSTSIGIILFPVDAETAEQALQHADTAMYVAKTEGRNRYHFFHPSMVDELDARLATEASIIQAIERDEFQVYYQPKVDGHGRLLGAEALLRWRDPARGIVAPDDFLPVLHRLGLIRDVEFTVMEKVCADLRRWLAAGCWIDGGRLSINISSGQFRSRRFTRRAASLIEQAGVAADSIELELTEQLFIDDADTAASIMDDLKEQGFRLAIDDFGTGYSSLMYLKKMPLDILKIDQGFIRDLPDDEDDAVIVDTIISMANYLDLKLVAEGVETQEQLDYLTLRDVREFQGFYFAHPMPASRFESCWLKMRDDASPVGVC